MTKRMTRQQRKGEILSVLRENETMGGCPLTCRKVAQRMGLRGYSYVNSLLQELCDDGAITVYVKPSSKAISNVTFEYTV